MKSSSEKSSTKPPPDIKGKWVEVYDDGLRIAKAVGWVDGKYFFVRLKFPAYTNRGGVHRYPVNKIRAVFKGKKGIPMGEWMKNGVT